MYIFSWSKQIVWNHNPHLNTETIEKPASDYVASIEAADLETNEEKTEHDCIYEDLHKRVSVHANMRI